MILLIMISEGAAVPHNTYMKICTCARKILVLADTLKKTA